MGDYLLKEECYKIIGCAMEVHKALGAGLLEAVYQEALELEFLQTKIPYEKENFLEVWYKEKLLKKKDVADFMCFDDIIVEIKAKEALCDDHIAQVLNYLKATGKKIGLLINFGSRSLQYKRVIF